VRVYKGWAVAWEHVDTWLGTQRAASREDINALEWGSSDKTMKTQDNGQSTRAGESKSRKLMTGLIVGSSIFLKSAWDKTAQILGGQAPTREDFLIAVACCVVGLWLLFWAVHESS
jgi:hypothetical protein